ncbi:hypothetical protein FOZ61_010107 [Perkinsus olseni]|uniref:Uncharacterized protein n=1 Tax=Perkinsus olseni TaxID=32597 RepID=A0A7J6KZ83_PEROL|nr:hypothetical protein FOZ61_010107 [Perkinsus olseni]
MALVGAVLSLALGLVGLALLPLPEVPSLEWLATLAGVLHFLSYYCLLRAYSEIPSTVITPLLQLSALLMLPLHAITGTKPISPLTIMATVVTTIGGLLPAVRGDITLLVQPGFWCGDRGLGVSLCILSEVLSVAYNILMHFCYPLVEDFLLSSAFAAYSRCGNGLCALSLVLMVPSIRYGMIRPRAERRLMLVQDATTKSPTLRRVRVRLGFKCLAGALLSQGLSLLGVSLAPFAYARCSSAALVNAAEGGLQQVCNLVLAVFLWSVAGVGRPASDIGVKVASAIVVLAGLYMSTADRLCIHGVFGTSRPLPLGDVERFAAQQWPDDGPGSAPSRGGGPRAHQRPRQTFLIVNAAGTDVATSNSAVGEEIVFVYPWSALAPSADAVDNSRLLLPDLHSILSGAKLSSDDAVEDRKWLVPDSVDAAFRAQAKTWLELTKTKWLSLVKSHDKVKGLVACLALQERAANALGEWVKLCGRRLEAVDAGSAKERLKRLEARVRAAMVILEEQLPAVGLEEAVSASLPDSPNTLVDLLPYEKVKAFLVDTLSRISRTQSSLDEWSEHAKARSSETLRVEFTQVASVTLTRELAVLKSLVEKIVDDVRPALLANLPMPTSTGQEVLEREKEIRRILSDDLELSVVARGEEAYRACLVAWESRQKQVLAICSDAGRAAGIARSVEAEGRMLIEVVTQLERKSSSNVAHIEKSAEAYKGYVAEVVRRRKAHDEYVNLVHVAETKIAAALRKEMIARHEFASTIGRHLPSSLADQLIGRAAPRVTIDFDADADGVSMLPLLTDADIPDAGGARVNMEDGRTVASCEDGNVSGSSLAKSEVHSKSSGSGDRGDQSTPRE